MNIYCSEPGYGPEDSQIQLNMSGRKGRKEALQKMEHIMRQ